MYFLLTAEANRNSDNVPLVRAIITAGLYPNVARALPVRRPKPHKKPKLLTAYERSVSLHPKSVNEKECQFESPWIMYREKIKSSKVNGTVLGVHVIIVYHYYGIIMRLQFFW